MALTALARLSTSRAEGMTWATAAQARDRAAWRNLYERAPEAAIWHPLPFMEALLGRLRQRTGLPLVDLACGDGAQMTALPPDLDLIGIDQSDHALVRARKRVVAPAAAFVAGQLEAIPFATGAAGGALMIDVLHSFLEPLAVLGEAFRILSPGAALGLTAFTPADPLARARAAKPGRPVWIGDFVNTYRGPADVAALARCVGFAVEHVEARRDPDDPHPGFRDEAHWHERAVVVARKPSIPD